MAHTFHGQSIDIIFNALFDKKDQIKIVDKKFGKTLEIDVIDIINFINEEYLPYNQLKERD